MRSSDKPSYRDREAGPQEIELERLFARLLPGTRFEDKVFAVGGYVRDQLQGLEPADLDVVVELPYGAQRLAGFLMDTFPGAVSNPKPLTYDFPIWYQTFLTDVEWAGEHYFVAGAEIDLTDSQTLDRLEDESTTRFGPLSEDVKRRDFTINMLFKNLTSGEIVDPTGTGRSDIEVGLVRGRPTEDQVRAFREQPRRMLRLIRFIVQYGWHPDTQTKEALEESRQYLNQLDLPTLKKELGKWKKRGILKDGLTKLHEYGMTPYLQQVLKTYRGQND